MENLIVKGKVVRILPQQSGESSNGSWKKQEFIIETDGTYPKNICILGFNEMADKVAALANGDEVEVFVNIESREYNSRWYTDIKAWKIDSSKEVKPKTTSEPEYSGKDLPF
jgi:hypothetical protein